VLPGTYVRAAHADDLPIRMAAVAAWQPDALITGAAAARLTFWPGLRVDDIDVAWRGHAPRASGYRFSQRRIAPEHVVETAGLRIVGPALTAVDLSDSLGGDPIDTVLRSRMARIGDLWLALEDHQGRIGNVARRRLLVESRDEPWSAAERRGHHLLHAHGVRGWTANYPVLIRGQRYFIDIAFVSARLAVEIDGRLHENDRSIFERDRYRQNELVHAGWKVLRFTWSMLVNDPEYVVATIVAELSRRG
jgi:very-short-patch-repair endonuclease